MFPPSELERASHHHTIHRNAGAAGVQLCSCSAWKPVCRWSANKKKSRVTWNTKAYVSHVSLTRFQKLIFKRLPRYPRNKNREHFLLSFVKLYDHYKAKYFSSFTQIRILSEAQGLSFARYPPWTQCTNEQFTCINSFCLPKTLRHAYYLSSFFHMRKLTFKKVK